MDSAALHELMAQVRGTAAALAEAEQRVASFTAELAQQDRGAQPDTKPAQQTRAPIAKRGGSGWVAAG
jgi:ABC-type transporter Mla subunit MlaD